MDASEFPSYLVFRFKEDPKFRYGILAAAGALLILFLLSASQPAPTMAKKCGDGTCDREIEDAISCPADCASSGKGLKTVIVKIISGETGLLKIFLEDTGGALIASESGIITALRASGVPSSAVRARALNPLNHKTAESDVTPLIEIETEIELMLFEGFFSGPNIDMSSQFMLLDISNESGVLVSIYDDEGNLISEQIVSNLSDLEFEEPGMVYVMATLPNGTMLVSGTFNSSNFTGAVLYPLIPSPQQVAEANCSDGTASGHCSLSKPGYCQNGSLYARCDLCGCPDEKICSSRSCIDESLSVNCQGTLGDLNGDGSITQNDLTILAGIIAALQSEGYSAAGASARQCADVNGDNYLTADDYVCLTGFMDRVYSSFSDCADCAVLSPLEICNDGADNNCDGQTDRETYDNAAERFYGFPSDPDDLCECELQTDCSMIYIIDGMEGYEGESEIKRCSAISGISGGSYEWHLQSEWRCTPEKTGWALSCGGSVYTCSGLYDWFSWRGSAGTYMSYLCFGLEPGSGGGCAVGGGIDNCGSCAYSEPGYFDYVREHASGEGWGACIEYGDNCECRCNRNKLYCADYFEGAPQRSCWASSGDSSCGGEIDYDYCSKPL